MKRKIYDKLVQWKQEQDGTTALLIEGARRIGKSYIAEEFARNEYKSYIMIDFSKAPARVKSWFDDYLEDVDTLLQNIQLHYKKTLTPRESLIIFDEVQKCPAFAKHRGALHNALKGYTRLNNKAFQKIQPGGILFTFSCSQVVTKDNFRNAVFTAAAQAGRNVRILHQLHQPADHPINIYHPEGEYLKGLVLYAE